MLNYLAEVDEMSQDCMDQLVGVSYTVSEL